MAESADLSEELRKEYCPPLDDAVFYAIISDYDTTNQDELQSFRVTLDLLKASALEEDNTEFDPSGTSTFSGQQQAPESLSSHDEGSASNGLASLSTGLSESRWGDSDFGSSLEEMSPDMKTQWLQNMFPEVDPFTISYTLKKSGESLSRSIDELLNVSFLDIYEHEKGTRSSVIPKGIDGFLSDENAHRGRKKKGRRKGHTTPSTRSSSNASVLTDGSNGRQNVWANLTEDVDYICARTSLSPQAVKSLYHNNGASLPATIRALALKGTTNFTTFHELDPLIQLQVVELRSDFPAIPESELYGLLYISRSITSAAHELATAMTTLPVPVQTGKVSDLAHYAPLKISDEAEWHGPGSSSSWHTVSSPSSISTAAAKSAAASTAFIQASAAYRRGKSDHLMGGAAAYYSSVGRDQVKAAKELNAAAADAHVAAQSSSTVVDLHGVSVADAVRIANVKVNTWWDGLGDSKFASGGGGPARSGYRIVTGIGRHSRDGAPRIGPAVSRMLLREGWKVEIGQGELIVYGRARR